MLPRTYSLRRSDIDRLARLERTNAIGNYAIERPVAAANDVTRSHAGYRLAVLGIFFGIEETPAPRRNGYLGRALARRIGIVTAHRLILAITPNLLFVLVTFVGGNHDADLHVGGRANSLHDVHGSHHVRTVGLGGTFIAETHERLGSQMEYYLGPILGEDLFHLLAVADIGANILLDSLADAAEHEIIAVGRRIESHARHLGSEFVEPYRQPRTLEARMSRDENAFAAVEIIENIDSHTLIRHIGP